MKKKEIKWKVTPVSPDFWEKQEKERQEAEKKARQEEENRIQKLECPFCKSTSKEHIVKTGSNDVYGPGYLSWIIDEYYYCLKCGVMYKDLNKKK